MPAKSKAQQRFFGLVRRAQKGKSLKGLRDKAKIHKVAKSVSKESAKHFAQTKSRGLPKRRRTLR